MVDLIAASTTTTGVCDVLANAVAESALSRELVSAAAKQINSRAKSVLDPARGRYPDRRESEEFRRAFGILGVALKQLPDDPHVAQPLYHCVAVRARES